MTSIQRPMPLLYILQDIMPELEKEEAKLDAEGDFFPVFLWHVHPERENVDG